MAKPPVPWPVWLMLALASQDNLWKFVVAPACYGVTTPQLIQLVLPRKMGIVLQEFLDVDFVGSVQWSRSSRSLRATPGWERICCERAAELAKKAKDLPPPSRGISMDDVDLSYSRSSGPGGQNVNKVETKVQASFDVGTAKFLPNWVKENLRKQQVNRFNKDGVLIVSCEEQRTRQDNLRIVMQKLQGMIDKAAFKPKMPDKAKVNKMRRAKRAANEKRLQDKKLKSKLLQKRREAKFNY
ncbi:unnamed protein product [Cladocopium goreaui]|uniref:Large ribosomal subunit protein mL62 (Immature colon carcinoma transcript 1 protein homolog) (Peptidyl-tRNA hydrolase ICT1, mitochondrial) n=1 Tax=Cladocopium goreaui TaxID=2562237 RepID=A0A9P1DHR8_9DINO|nr:unnamed protein product [Cladocopium goreaui]